MKNLSVSRYLLVYLCFLLISCSGPDPVELTGDNIICFGDSLTYGTGAWAVEFDHDIL
jgi:hypothetical protein